MPVTIKELSSHVRAALENDHQSNIRWLLRDFYREPSAKNRIKVEAALTEYQETFQQAAGVTPYDRERDRILASYRPGATRATLLRQLAREHRS